MKTAWGAGKRGADVKGGVQCHRAVLLDQYLLNTFINNHEDRRIKPHSLNLQMMLNWEILYKSGSRNVI